MVNKWIWQIHIGLAFSLSLISSYFYGTRTLKMMENCMQEWRWTTWGIPRIRGKTIPYGYFLVYFLICSKLWHCLKQSETCWPCLACRWHVDTCHFSHCCDKMLDGGPYGRKGLFWLIGSENFVPHGRKGSAEFSVLRAGSLYMLADSSWESWIAPGEGIPSKGPPLATYFLYQMPLPRLHSYQNGAGNWRLST